MRTSSRINPKLKVALVAIATHAGKTQIVHRCRAAGRQWNNVVDLHSHDELLLRLAVFALSPGAFVDLLTDASGYARHPLYRGVKILVDIMPPPLQQDKRLRSQHHLLIHQCYQPSQFALIPAVNPSLIAKI